VEKLRKVMGKATTRHLSAKERAFVEEVRSIEANISGARGDGSGAKPGKQPWKRLEDVKRLQAELAADVEALRSEEGTGVATPTSADFRIPQDIRRMKLQQIQGLLTRETALVEAVTSRLERLQTGV
jgi:nucleoporin NUP82